MPDNIPDAYFGQVKEIDPDDLPDDGEPDDQDDDEEYPVDQDFIDLLGFDPYDLEEAPEPKEKDNELE